MDLRKEVLYYDALVDFPTYGQENKLYLNKADGSLYYWDGAAYQLAGDGSGGVTSVSASSPLASSGGATPTISLSVPSDNTKFLDGTGAFDTVKDSDLSISDITTNNVSTSKHGFAPKAPNDATKFLDGTGAYDTVKDSDLSLSDVTTNDVSTTKHGFTPKAPNDTTKFLRGDGTWAVPAAGGLTKFTEAESTSSPNATIYVDSLTAAASSTNADFALIPKGTGALISNIPDGTGTGGNKRGTNAVDLQTKRYLATEVASGGCSGIVSGYRNTASGAYSFVGAGVVNYATTNSSAVVAGYNNSASGYRSFVGSGRDHTASGSYASIVGGRGQISSNSWTFVGGGYFNTASGYRMAAVVGGGVNIASGACSFVGGGYCNTANSTTSAILGGILNNTCSNADAFIVGSNINADRACSTFVNNLSIKNIPTSSSGLPSGSVWSDSGTLKIV